MTVVFFPGDWKAKRLCCWLMSFIVWRWFKQQYAYIQCTKELPKIGRSSNAKSRWWFCYECLAESECKCGDSRIIKKKRFQDPTVFVDLIGVFWLHPWTSSMVCLGQQSSVGQTTHFLEVWSSIPSKHPKGIVKHIQLQLAWDHLHLQLSLQDSVLSKMPSEFKTAPVLEGVKQLQEELIRWEICVQTFGSNGLDLRWWWITVSLKTCR